MRAKLMLLAGVMLFTMSASPARACMCEPEPASRTIKRLMKAATVIFTGTVTEVGRKIDGPRFRFWAKLKVKDAWKIDQQTELTFSTSGGCMAWFELGKTYLVYADPDSQGRLTTNVCMRTRSIEGSAEDRRQLGKPVVQAAPIMIAAQAPRGSSLDKCYRWQTQVDPSKPRIEIDQKSLSDIEIEEGIGCLLSLKGQRKKARFYGDTRANYERSQGYHPPKNPASIEIAALYYVSFLFLDNWEHAGSVALYDENTEKSNTREIAERAMKSYRIWFKKVLKLGLQKARQMKLDPLEGTGISWS